MKLIDLTGWTFGRLVVVGRSRQNTPQGHPMWDCFCDCGNRHTVRGTSLRGGMSKSCGCLSLEGKTVHGMTKTTEHTIWSGILQRCENKNNKAYRHYGGRGVKVCDRWKVFGNFHDDMGDRPSLKHSIDRINNDGDYEPANCRWATNIEQARNKRWSGPLPRSNQGVSK